MIQLNLHTPLRLTRGLAGSMVGKPNHSYIINIASIAGRQPMPNNAIYASTKWGFSGFSVSIFEASLGRTCCLPGMIAQGAGVHACWCGCAASTLLICLM